MSQNDCVSNLVAWRNIMLPKPGRLTVTGTIRTTACHTPKLIKPAHCRAPQYVLVMAFDVKAASAQDTGMTDKEFRFEEPDGKGYTTLNLVLPDGSVKTVEIDDAHAANK